jgi:hypothetical protein
VRNSGHWQASGWPQGGAGRESRLSNEENAHG